MATEKINYQAVVEAAFTAAAIAAAAHDAKHGQCYPFGFAWVKIKPARGPLVKAIKAYCAQTKKTVYVDGGLTVYNPSNNPTQSMCAKEDGVHAFINTLEKAGVVNTRDADGKRLTPYASANSRLD